MESRGTVFRNFVALGSGEALSRLIAFAATIYLARILGAEGFGVIAFAMAVNLYLVKISDFELGWTGTAEVAKAPESIPELASALLSARLAITIVAMGVSAIITWFVLPEPERSVLLLYFLVLLPTAVNTKWIHIGIDDARPVGLTRVLGEALSLAIIVTLVRNQDDLWIAPVAQFCSEFSIAFLLIVILRRRSYKFRLRRNLSIALPVLKKAFPVVSHSLIGLFIYNSDLIFLRIFHDSQSVGLYSVAYVLISFIANIGIAYGMSLTPTFTRLKNNSEEEISFYHTVLAHIFAVTLPISIGGYLLAADIIGLAFGDEYSGSVLALQLIIWSIPFNIFRYAPLVALISRNRQDLLFRAILYAAVANIILNLILIPRYDVAGAAIATIITEVLACALMLFFGSKLGLPFVNMRRLLRPLIAGIAMAIVLVAFSPSFLFSAIVLGSVAYLLALMLLGGIRYQKGQLPSLNI